MQVLRLRLKRKAFQTSLRMTSVGIVVCHGSTEKRQILRSAQNDIGKAVVAGGGLAGVCLRNQNPLQERFEHEPGPYIEVNCGRD